MISEKSSSDYSKGVRMRKFLVTLILVSTVISCSKDDGMDDNILNGTYAKKFNIIHYKTNPMYDVDKKTFEILSFDYAKDNEHIYFGNKIIAGADIQSFVLVGDYMSKDKNHVYYREMILEGADPETFFAIGGEIPKYFSDRKKYITEKENHWILI